MDDEENTNKEVMKTDSKMPYITYRPKYRRVKIEKMGEAALKVVLDGVRLGRSCRQIAIILSDTYNQKVTHRDVIKVLDSNAEIMTQYQKFLTDQNMTRANMILDESKILVDDMEKLDDVFQDLVERMKRVGSTKDLVEISKAMTDLSRTRASMVKSFKKLTGQYKEGPSIIIDQSQKQVNIQATPETVNKLTQELARAEFKTNVKPEEVIKEEPKQKVIEAEIVEEDKEEDDLDE